MEATQQQLRKVLRSKRAEGHVSGHAGCIHGIVGKLGYMGGGLIRAETGEHSRRVLSDGRVLTVEVADQAWNVPVLLVLGGPEILAGIRAARHLAETTVAWASVPE